MSTSGGRKTIPSHVLVTKEVKQKMERLVLHCDDEVYWFGLVDTVAIGPRSLLRIYDILVPKQEVSKSSVDMHGSMNELAEELITAGRPEDIGKIKAFCHSHVNMEVFHSGTDLDMLFDLGTKLGVPWFISLVTNKKGQYDIRWDQFSPFRMHVEEVTIIDIVPKEIDQWAKDQLEERVTKKPTTTVSYSGNTGFHSQGRNQGGYKPPKINYQDGRKKYPNAKRVDVRIEDGWRELIVDGYILERESMKDGTYETYRPPTDEEREKDLQQRAAQQQSRSIERSEGKRAEGKEEGGESSQDELPQTPTASDPRSGYASSSSDLDEEGEEVDDDELPPDLQVIRKIQAYYPDRNFSEEEAARVLEILDGLDPLNNEDDERTLVTIGMTPEVWLDICA